MKSRACTYTSSINNDQTKHKPKKFTTQFIMEEKSQLVVEEMVENKE